MEHSGNERRVGGPERLDPVGRLICLVVLAVSLMLWIAIPGFSAEKDGAPGARARGLLSHSGSAHPEGPMPQVSRGEAKIKGNFRLDSREGILRGGDLGPAVTLDRPEESLLLQAIRYEGLEMPPSGKLAAAEADVLTRWVKEGLVWPRERAENGPARESRRRERRPEPWPRGRRMAVSCGRSPPCSAGQEPGVGPRTRSMRSCWPGWSPRGCDLPQPADRVALIRRLTYDLTGLPPTPKRWTPSWPIRSPDAYERLVDRLLASPRYGEAWGRHWLDLVRYAETNGYERDSAKPFAWRYRDYVIDAFNRDKPYDRFLREQLAGDEIDRGSAEALIATGFYRLGIWDDEPADRRSPATMASTASSRPTGQVFLGMSINCARCHDHKKDPIPQRDYYRLLAFFRDVTDQDGKNTRTSRAPTRRIEVMCVRERGQSRRRTSCSAAIPACWARGSSPASRDPGRDAAPTFTAGPRQAAGPGRVADRPPQPDDGPRHGQPALAIPLRPGHRADAQRLRPAGRAGLASGAARLAGRRVHGGRLADQAHAPADPALERLPHVVAGNARAAGQRPGQSLVLAVPDAPAGRRGGARLDPRGQRHALNDKAGGPSVYPPIPREVLAGQSVPGRAGRSRRPPSRPGAASTST